MSAAANRGKSAEKQVRELLDGFNLAVAGFTFNRVPDAHMAGGRFPAQAGDFQAFVKGSFEEVINQTLKLTSGFIWVARPPAAGLPVVSRNFIVEVKEVKHDFRLPQKNYSADKVGRVQKRVWAGTEAVVAVLHTTTGLWRLVPFEVFTKRAPSWDLSKHPIVDIELALAEFMGVK